MRVALKAGRIKTAVTACQTQGRTLDSNATEQTLLPGAQIKRELGYMTLFSRVQDEKK